MGPTGASRARGNCLTLCASTPYVPCARAAPAADAPALPAGGVGRRGRRAVPPGAAGGLARVRPPRVLPAALVQVGMSGGRLGREPRPSIEQRCQPSAAAQLSARNGCSTLALAPAPLPAAATFTCCGQMRDSPPSWPGWAMTCQCWRRRRPTAAPRACCRILLQRRRQRQQCRCRRLQRRSWPSSSRSNGSSSRMEGSLAPRLRRCRRRRWGRCRGTAAACWWVART